MKSISHLKDSNTFCLLPFMHTYGSANGNLVLCCEAQEYECGKCNQKEIIVPKLDALEIIPSCPACGEDLEDDTSEEE